MKKSIFLDKRLYISIVAILIASFLLFFHLGKYAFWDDEADTALFAQSVWRTGDTYAMLDHNLIAHTSGQELRGLYNRYIPPLGFYIAAPFVGLNPGSAFAARFPFAFFGLLTITLILHWLYKSRASHTTWLLTCAGILCNVSFMLFFRQCRYYAPAIFFSTFIVYLYAHRNDQKTAYILSSILLLLLLCSHYLAYFALLGGLIVDYFVFERNKRPLTFSQSFIVFLPQMLCGGLLLSIYNLSFINNSFNYTIGYWIQSKAAIVFWNMRDLNNCEMGSMLLIILAPLLYHHKKNVNLVRCPLAILVYIIVIAIFSPMPIFGSSPSKVFDFHGFAEIRYIAPLIPLCIFVAVTTIETLAGSKKIVILFLAILTFNTNILNKALLLKTHNYAQWSSPIAETPVRSTILEFTKELISPNKSTYRATANWINTNLKNNETVWVEPSFANYPLMYHAPKALYAWQLKDRTPQNANLPDIHFVGKISPDYIIAFGPFHTYVKEKTEELAMKGDFYEKIEQLDTYWYDLIRPELFWHSFRNITNFNPEEESIYIYKKSKIPARHAY